MRFARAQFACIAAALLAALSAAAQQTYPTRPIHVVVPFGAGSSTDQLARALAQTITEATKQPVIVEPRPGANGFIGVQAVANAVPDGYTVLFGSSATHGINAYLYKNVPYDPVKDFTPVTTLSRGAFILAVNPMSPATTLQQLIQRAKAEPGKVSIGTGTPGTRLAGELLQQRSGAQFLHVPYKTIPAAINDLLGGQVDLTIADGGILLPMVNGGKLRALAVSGTSRWESLPDVPTVQEGGVPGYEATYWTAAWLPAKAPPAVVSRLNELLVRAVKAPAAQRFFHASSIESFTMSPDELGEFQIAQSEAMRRLVKAAGIVPE